MEAVAEGELATIEIRRTKPLAFALLQYPEYGGHADGALGRPKFM